jgi:DNA-binding NarL/FixJ family response regulator
MQTGTGVQVLHVMDVWQREGHALRTYRPEIKPELRVAGQNEPLPIVELPPALDESEADRSQPTEPHALAVEERLTPRAAEIASFVAEGLSNKQIARKATISEATVKIHLHRAFTKLGIANRSTLAVMVSSALARRQGQ